MLAMAKRRTKRKRKVLTVKFDDMQRTNNVVAAVRSFEGPTKATLAIAVGGVFKKFVRWSHCAVSLGGRNTTRRSVADCGWRPGFTLVKIGRTD